MDRDTEIQQMYAMNNLLDTDGWLLLSDYIKGRIEDNLRQLLTCPVEKVELHRAKVKTLESVFLYVQEVIDKGKEALVEDE